MRKLQALVRHILTETGISRENVSAFLDQGAAVLTGRNLGYGVEVCVLKYDGVIDIERSDYDGSRCWRWCRAGSRATTPTGRPRRSGGQRHGQ